MGKASATVAADAAKASSVAHPPVPMIQRSPEEDTGAALTFIQRSVSALGSGSPQTPPENFASALGHWQGSPSLQTSIMRQLQRSYGNSYVGGVIQTKLTINQPGDIYEQEADRVADMVMLMLDSEVSGISNGATGIQRTCAACASGQGLCPQCAEEERLQRKPLAATITPLIQREGEGAANHASQVTPQVAANIDALRGGGQPLPPSVRAFFEPRFGVDFSAVRVHTDSQAAETARSVNARAFTVGREMVFGAGQFAPGTSDGRRLLGHELTHVVQQSENMLPNPNLIGSIPTNCIQRVTFQDCRDDQIPSLTTANNEAISSVNQVINRLAPIHMPQTIRDALWLAFRDNSIRTSQEVFANLTEIRDGLPSATIECEQEDSPSYDEYCDRYAGYLGGSSDNIHICMGSFRETRSREQMLLIIHEGSHRFNRTRDFGYFYYPCNESDATAPLSTPSRLENADSYECFVYFVLHEDPARLTERVANYHGQTLAGIGQSPPGEINLNNDDVHDPTFDIRLLSGRIAILGGFEYRWVIADTSDNRYQMWGEDGQIFQYGQHHFAFIPARTRALLKSRGIRAAEVLCRARMPGIGTRLFRLPVRFTF